MPVTSSSQCLYVGIRSHGTTSFLRSEAMQLVFPRLSWDLIDTDQIFQKQSRLWKSLAFRFRAGRAVAAVNRDVLIRLSDRRYKVTWVDKGVLLYPETVRRLRECSEKLIYYTPDTSFLHNQSRFFERTIQLYDLVVTTKSPELPMFLKRIPEQKLLLTTQSFDSRLHRPRHAFAEKKRAAVLIGLCEPSRTRCVEALLERGIPVNVGGQGWTGFARRYRNHPAFQFVGDRVFGEQYAEMLSQAWVGLGMLTRRFQELHTTRTFEIPACGTVLATPDNKEIRSIFNADEALFFSSTEDLGDQIQRLFADPERAECVAAAGMRRVHFGCYDNDGLVKDVFARLGPEFD